MVRGITKRGALRLREVQVSVFRVDLGKHVGGHADTLAHGELAQVGGHGGQDLHIPPPRTKT